MNVVRNSVWLVVFVAVFVSPLAFGAPKLVSYQGKLADSGGNPINATVSMTFTIFDSASGGVSLWTENQNVLVSNGIFSVQLGAAETLDSSVFDTNGDLYLGIRVGSDQEMTPRQKFASGAFSQTAAQLDHEIQGEEIAREAVWPVHEGRNNTIASYYGQFTSNSTTSFVMPADKKFIITDISYHYLGSSSSDWTASCAVAYSDGSGTKTLFKAQSSETSTETSKGDGKHFTFRAGLPVPAGATLLISSFDGNQWSTKSCTVAGFEIPATE